MSQTSTTATSQKFLHEKAETVSQKSNRMKARLKVEALAAEREARELEKMRKSSPSWLREQEAWK